MEWVPSGPPSKGCKQLRRESLWSIFFYLIRLWGLRVDGTVDLARSNGRKGLGDLDGEVDHGLGQWALPSKSPSGCRR